MWVSSGIAPDWLLRMREHTLDIIAMWGGPARIAQYPLEEPI